MTSPARDGQLIIWAYRQLLELHPQLTTIICIDRDTADEERVLITGDARQKQEAQEMIKLITNRPDLWHSLAIITRYLEPLAKAASIVQKSFCRLDQMLLTFGFLIMQYKQPGMDADPVGRDAIISSLESRWNKFDQELYIATLLVNPFYRDKPFAKLPSLTEANIKSLFHRLWMRLFRSDVPDDFDNLKQQFFTSSGPFVYLETECAHAERSPYSDKTQVVDPTYVLDAFKLPGHPPSSFLALGQRLLSISAQSVARERLFGDFGDDLTTLRTRLKTESLTNLMELNWQIQCYRSNERVRSMPHFQAYKNTSQIDDTPTPDASMPSTQATTDTTPTQNESIESETPHTRNVFRSIVEHQIQRAEEDAKYDGANFPSVFEPVALSTLFDLENREGDAHWSNLYVSHARLGVDDRLELCDLAELDSGEEDDGKFDDGTWWDLLNS